MGTKAMVMFLYELSPLITVNYYILGTWSKLSHTWEPRGKSPLSFSMLKYSKINLEGFWKPYFLPRARFVSLKWVRLMKLASTRKQRWGTGIVLWVLEHLLLGFLRSSLYSCPHHISSFIHVVWLVNSFMKYWSFYPIKSPVLFNLFWVGFLCNQHFPY